MFKLSPETEAELMKARELELNMKDTFRSLSHDSLIASAKYWMQHCEPPKRFKPDEPIYDATFWHVILPELIRRLESK